MKQITIWMNIGNKMSYKFYTLDNKVQAVLSASFFYVRIIAPNSAPRFVSES